MGLFSKPEIVGWEPGYYPDISTATAEQRKSYNRIKETIEKGRYIECSDAYLYSYNYELNSEIASNVELEITRWKASLNKYLNFINLYEVLNPKVTSYFYPWAILALAFTKQDIRDFLERYMEFYMANNLSGDSDFIVSLYVSAHQINSSKDKIEGRLFRAFAGEDLRKHLTSTGKKFYSEVMQVLDVLLQEDYEKSDINYLYRLYDFEKGAIHIDVGEFANFEVTSAAEKPLDRSGFNFQVMVPTYNEVKKSAYIRAMLREAENLVRNDKGLQKIGEGWVSETLLFRQIEAAFKGVEVIQHASPSFLGQQHYDVYIPKLKIALEYQGDQHYRPIEFFGGEEAFIKGQERDERKLRLSKENGILQLNVNPGYEIEEVLSNLLSRKLASESEKFKKLLSAAVTRAKEASVKVSDLTNQKEEAINRIQNVAEEAELSEFKYDLKIKKLLAAQKPTPNIKEIDYVNVSEDKFKRWMDKLNEVKEVGKQDPVKSNELAFKLIDSGYTAPAIYERIAINYRKQGLLQEELDFLLQTSKDFDYNFKERIKQILKKMG